MNKPKMGQIVASEFDGVWLIIPAFNEGSVIEGVAARAVERFRNVVVVDDCSSDDTSARAMAAGAHVARHPINLGQGAALQTGIEYALGQHARLIVTFDADGQHQLEDVESMIKLMGETGANAVLGSRFLGSTENLPRLRRIILKAAVHFSRWTSGLPLTDAHNGLRVLDRETAGKLRLTQNRMAHASEITDRLGQMKAKVVEAPVKIVYSAYSLRKGQKLSNSLNILVELLVRRISP